MSNRTLEYAFDAFFHGKESFSDFCSFKLEQEITSFSANSNSLSSTPKKLSLPSKRLKNYLRFIDKVLLRWLEKNDEVVHSYIKEKSAFTAVKAHSKNSHFYMTDIKSFFSNISKNDVNKILKQNIDRIPVSDIELYIDKLVDMMTWENELPIGFPTSPQLSNAVLYKFDESLHSYCKKNRLAYTRYSDDIIISGNSFDGFDQLTKTVQTYLDINASSNLVLNIDKTHLTHVGNKVKILGLVITPDGRVTINSKYKRKLEVLLHFYVSDKNKFKEIVNETLQGNEHSIFGLLHYAKSVDPLYLEKLQRKYGTYALRSLMKGKKDD